MGWDGINSLFLKKVGIYEIVDKTMFLWIVQKGWQRPLIRHSMWY